ncbi:hypothetical protein AB6805_30555 [Chitinophaga sp. RCC_12]|uniref:hypothetical protein n=1 Tax=Chitinophaga sp. RCC_12 TaxID=3239226 RepID=UPI00352515E8
MSTTEANIKITRNGDKLASIAVSMPVWNKISDHNHLLIKLPLLGIDTIAKDEMDAEKAIEEAIISFCIVADKHGQGIEKELQALGWKSFSCDNNEPGLEYDVPESEDMLERLLETGDNYVNPHLLVDIAA